MNSRISLFSQTYITGCGWNIIYGYDNKLTFLYKIEHNIKVLTVQDPMVPDQQITSRYFFQTYDCSIHVLLVC